MKLTNMGHFHLSVLMLTMIAFHGFLAIPLICLNLRKHGIVRIFYTLEILLWMKILYIMAWYFLGPKLGLLLSFFQLCTTPTERLYLFFTYRLFFLPKAIHP